MDFFQFAFNFTPEDLAHNLTGVLSPAQERAMARFLRLSGCFAIGLVLFVLLVFWGLWQLGLIGKIVALLMLGAILFNSQSLLSSLRDYLDWRRSWHAGKLVSLEISTSDFTPAPFRDHVFSKLTKDGLEITFTSTQFGLLESGRTYQLFVWTCRDKFERFLSIRVIDLPEHAVE